MRLWLLGGHALRQLGRLGKHVRRRLEAGSLVGCYVQTERTVRATGEYYVGTQISTCHVCAHRMRRYFQRQAFCAHMTEAGVSGEPLADLQADFGSSTIKMLLF